MKKSDWVTLRLLRKMMRSPAREIWVGDGEVRKAALYLHKKYGEKKVWECIDLLIAEERGVA